MPPKMHFHILEQPETISVYRVDNGKHNALDNRNGGTLVGILDYLDICEERLIGTGDYLSAFEVLVKEGYDGYVEFVGGKPRISSAQSLMYVGRRVRSENNSWYSFPANGKWAAHKRGSILLDEIYAYLRQKDAPMTEQTLAFQAECIEQLFHERF